MMNAEIISIGNELLIGDTVNTNASWIGRFLTEKGFRIRYVHTIPDHESVIGAVLREAMGRSQLIVTTGGLGPTHDDITKKVVAEIFDSELVMNEKVLSFIESIFNRRGLTMSRSNIDQALVPGCCQVLFNRKGTAPGLWLEENGSCLAVLPGVPYEMRYLMEKEVTKRIAERFSDQEFRAVRYLKTAGVSESHLSDEVIGELASYLNGDVEVAYLPSPSGVTLRVTATGGSDKESDERLQPVLEYIYRRAGGFIYGEGRDRTLSEVIGTILRERKLTLSVAESCTGGFLANSLTDHPGSSDFFLGGVVAYDNAVKQSLLKVSLADIEREGAVSRTVALQMAEGVATRTGSDIGVSTTGIAGPGGGTEEKPVGTVWMGFYLMGERFALKAQFTNDRLINKERTATVVLETVRRKLNELDHFPYGLKPVYS
ncbi:MAG: competence/damage-inducible protein A [Balneolaceae bacterium]